MLRIGQKAEPKIRTEERPITQDPVFQLLSEKRPHFLGFLRGLLKDGDAAEEVLQGVFLKLLERGSRLRDAAKAEAWLYRTLRNAAMDYYRRNFVQRQALDEFVRQPKAKPAGNACECAPRELTKLHPEYASALQEMEMAGAKVEDYAQRHGVTANNVSVRLYRARKALRKRVTQVCGSCAGAGCFDCTCAPPSR